MERVPFLDAISDDQLLKKPFESLSWPQRITLKALYGCPLSERVYNPANGLSELDYWAIIQGSCTYDDLGFVTSVTRIPYEPKEYNQLWAVVGRRAGKTSTLMAFIIAYEAMLGGHEEYVTPGQENVIYMIAHRMSLAQASLTFVRAILLESPLLARELVDSPATELKFKNGIRVVPSPPSLKAQRGMAVPVVGMDEVGFWYTDPDSANPDLEVEAAVRYSQIQFPFNKRIGISTPWAKEGLLWKYYNAGTGGCKLTDPNAREQFKDVLVVFAPTASFENPRITREVMQRVKVEDPENFPRESLCQFLDSISGFLSSQLVFAAANRAKGIAERAKVPAEDVVQPIYVAAMDPAFRQDTFAFMVCHKTLNDGVVVDCLRQFKPMRGQKLNPKEVLAQIIPLAKSYGCENIWSDQYQLESLQQLALEMDMTVIGMDFTATSKAKVYGNLQQLLNQQKLTLLDPDVSEDAATLVRELISLERRTGGAGRVMIAAPEGKHDDMASVLALGAFQSTYLDPDVKIEVKPSEPTLFELGMATIRKHQPQIDSAW